MKTMLKNIDIALKVLEEENTVENLQKVLVLHKELGQKAYVDQSFGKHKIARIKIEKVIVGVIEANKEDFISEDIHCTIFVQAKGYNINVSRKTGNAEQPFEAIFTFKTYDLDIVEKLEDDFGFYVR
jgi:hypothetical protein